MARRGSFQYACACVFYIFWLFVYGLGFDSAKHLDNLGNGFPLFHVIHKPIELLDTIMVMISCCWRSEIIFPVFFFFLPVNQIWGFHRFTKGVGRSGPAVTIYRGFRHICTTE